MENLILINRMDVKNVMAEGSMARFQRLSFINYNLHPEFEYSNSLFVMGPLCYLISFLFVPIVHYIEV
jgi:hypothetical protein